MLAVWKLIMTKNIYLVLITLFAFGLICFLFSNYFSKQTHESLLFPASPPFNEGYLEVSPLHKLWYAEYGNPKGKPVIVLHGGPGAGCGENDMRYFDPKFWRIILLDQRGAKRSKPFAEV